MGPKALSAINYTSRREAHLGASERTAYRGALRPWGVTDPTTGQPRRFRVAYIWSSEEQRSVRDARNKALARAEEALSRVANGLGGRFYRTKAQVDTKVAQVLPAGVAPLMTVKTGERGGKPTLSFSRNAQAASTLAAVAPASSRSTTLTSNAATAGRRRAHFQARSQVGVGRARIGSPAR